MTKNKPAHFCMGWRIDQDYAKKLSKEDRDWLEKFNDEYYRSKFDPEDLLHSKEQKNEIEKNYNHSNNDIVTKSGKQMAKAAEIKATKYNKSRYYQPTDYAFANESSTNPEEEIVSALDEAK